MRAIGISPEGILKYIFYFINVKGTINALMNSISDRLYRKCGVQQKGISRFVSFR